MNINTNHMYNRTEKLLHLGLASRDHILRNSYAKAPEGMQNGCEWIDFKDLSFSEMLAGPFLFSGRWIP